MGFLPIPGDMYIDDAPDKSYYSIHRNNELTSNVEGIKNSDEDGRHIAFLYGTDVVAGDSIQTPNGKTYNIKFTDIDEYEGEPAIIKAYY